MSPLPRLLALVTLTLGLSLPLSAEKPSFAVVDAPRAFDAYYVTKIEKDKVAAARAKLRNDARVEQIKLTQVELLELRNEVRDTTLADDVRQEYFRKFQMKAHELNSLQRDTANHVEEQTKIIDEAMVKKTKHLLGVIRAQVQEIAKAEGYDFVFEKGGTTSSQISTLIYIRHATDITDQVIAALNKDAPKDPAVAKTP